QSRQQNRQGIKNATQISYRIIPDQVTCPVFIHCLPQHLNTQVVAPSPSGLLPMTDFSLPPSGARARAIDLRMRQSLADSLDYIGSEIRPLIDFNQGAMAELTGQLRRGARFTPSIFALYTELVLALE